MAQISAALASLLPVAGAVALSVLGVRRMMRNAADPKRAAPPQAKEPPAPAPRQRHAKPDGLCASCGTTVPARLTLCASCARAETGPEFSGLTLATHWLVFLAVMATIIGAGWLLTS